MDKFKSILKWIFNSFIWLGVLLLVLDFVSKQVIIANKEIIREQGGIILIPGFLRINYLINNNLVFGLSTGNDIINRVIFCVVALIIVIALIWWMVKKWDKLDRVFKACIMMIIAGAFGNVIDRIFYSPDFLSNSVNGVVDWIDFYGVWPFNFNIADSSVVIAAFMLIIYMIVVDIIDFRARQKSEKKEEDNTKVLSKTELEKKEFVEKQENKDE